MSESKVPEPIKYILWGKAAGRCQYRGCNHQLYLDVGTTKAEFNQAYIAHIIADKIDGPRGNPIDSPLLGKDISNLMLLCDTHHRLIDKVDVVGHTVEILREMKKQHEERIELLTSNSDSIKSHIIHFGANVGESQHPLRKEYTYSALSNEYYPATSLPIELSMLNSSINEYDEAFWNLEILNLKRQIETKVKPLISVREIAHISLFAIAPQPLLILLGTLLTELCPTKVYQLHREPKQEWKWKVKYEEIEFIVNRGDESKEEIALNISLSATITNDRILKVLGENTAIWTITIPNPNPECIQNEVQLQEFRILLRKILDQIKELHGHDKRISIFPSMPLSTAIELGRVWMPKADLPLVIFDENRKLGGFIRTFSIGE